MRYKQCASFRGTSKIFWISACFICMYQFNFHTLHCEYIGLDKYSSTLCPFSLHNFTKKYEQPSVITKENGQSMLLFGKLVDLTQISKPKYHTDTFKQNFTSIFPSVRPKLLVTFHYEIPCSLWSSDRPNIWFGRTVRPNFYVLVRPKWQNLFLQNTELFSLLYIAFFKLTTLDISSLAYVNNIIISVLTK